MKLIIGLGNPGKEYNHTRHNMGFECIDFIINKLRLNNKITKFNADMWFYFNNNNEKIIFAKPLSFMNLSGNPVNAIASYYKISKDDIYVIFDDKDLPFGNLKLKVNGSAGGHNGIKDIMLKLNYSNIKRIKIGIGFNSHFLIKDWVLNKLSEQEKKDILLTFNRVYKVVMQLCDDVDLLRINSLQNF